MKKLHLLFISLALIMGTTNVSSQKWLDKLNKGLDNVNKGLDDVNKTLDKVAPSTAQQSNTNQNQQQSQNQQSQPANNPPAKPPVCSSVTSPIRNLKIEPVDCYASGNDVVLEFTATNTSQNPTMYLGFGGKSMAYDTNGEQYDVDSNSMYKTQLPEGTKVKITQIIKDVSSKTTKFPTVKLDLYFAKPTDAYGENGELIFKNVSIDRGNSN